MNALWRKEARLLLPSWCVAMALAAAPIWLIKESGEDIIGFSLLLGYLGLVVLSLGTFGGEMSHGVWSGLLAQPIHRLRLWRVKIAVLAGACLACVVAMYLSWTLAGVPWGKSGGGDSATIFWQVFGLGGSVALAGVAGSLMAPLALRHVSGGFWIALLFPVAICMLVSAFAPIDASEAAINRVLIVSNAVYALACLLSARQVFLRAQDLAWTGGTLSPPAWMFGSRRFRSWVTRGGRVKSLVLLMKEFQLNHVALLASLGLLFLHIGIICTRTFPSYKANNSFWRLASEFFWLIWPVVPALLGATAVAEERRLAVLDTQLCLPVSRRRQYLIKAGFVFTLALLFGFVAPWAIELMASRLGLPNFLFGSYYIDGSFQMGTWLVVTLGLTALSLYASTLSKNFLQAVGLTITLVIVLTPIVLALFNNLTVDGLSIWGDFLGGILVCFLLFIAVLFLGLRNYTRAGDPAGLLLRNVLGLFLPILFSALLSSLCYHRAWELLVSPLPKSTTTRLGAAGIPSVRWGGMEVNVTLPDRRLWFAHLSESEPESPHPTLARAISGRDNIDLSENGWVGREDWRDLCPWAGGVAGIRKDGSLWTTSWAVSDHSPPGLIPPFNPTGGAWTRVGTETNWVTIVESVYGFLAMIKADGTLWWCARRGPSVPRGPDAGDLVVERWGSDSNFTGFELSGGTRYTARKSDGTRWVLETDRRQPLRRLRLGGLADWKSLDWEGYVPFGANESVPVIGVGVRPDGSLGFFTQVFRSARRKDNQPQQISYEQRVEVLDPGQDWIEAGYLGKGKLEGQPVEVVIALKADGSLWEARFYSDRAPLRAMRRLGADRTWVALSARWNKCFVLASDGGAFLWDNADFSGYDQLIQPSRYPQFIGNIFASVR